MSGETGYFPGVLFSAGANVGGSLPSASLSIATLVNHSPMFHTCISLNTWSQWVGRGGPQVFMCIINVGALTVAGR